LLIHSGHGLETSPRVNWRKQAMTLFKRAVLSTFAVGSVAFAAPAFAQEASHSITIRDHKFEPSTLNVKAGVKIKLTVTNAQKEAAEFESAELNREKIVPPGSSVTVYLGPLEPGRYGFFDDFHQAAKGTIVAK
jgi:plastocyanin